MPVYEIQGKDGRIYEIEGPAGLSRQQVIAAVLAQAPEAGQPRPEKSPIEEVPIIGGALSAAADVPLALTSGIATTAKSVTDIFGPDNIASGFLEDVGEGSRRLLSREAREDFARDAREMEQAEGFLETVGAAGKAFLRHPIDTSAQLVGSAVPFVGAALTGAGIPGAVALGAASGVGMVKDEIYDATYNRAVEAGIDEAKAKEIATKAQGYGGENLDMITLGGGIGAIASATGVTPRLAALLGKKAAADVVENIASRAAAREGAKQTTKGFARKRAEGFVSEALPEGIQASQSQFAQNLAQQRAGFDTDLMDRVLEQGVYEGTLGGILGGVMPSADRGATGADADITPVDEQSDEERTAQTILREVLARDPDLTDAQRDAASVRATKIMVRQGVRAEDAIRVAKNEQLRMAEVATRRAEGAGEPVGADAGRDELGVPSTVGGLGGEPDAVEAEGVGDGGLGETGGLPVEPDAGAGAGEPALEQAILGKMPMAERISIANQIISGTVMADPALQVIPPEAYGPAARQIAQAAARGTILDAPSVLREVAGLEVSTAPALDIEEVAPTQVAPTPGAEPLTQPSVDEAAVAPVVSALEAAKQSTPDITPTPAETAARDTGIAPTPVQEEIVARDEDVSQDLVAPPEAEPVQTVDETLTDETLDEPVVEAAPDDFELTPETYVDRYLAGEGRGTTPTDLKLQQYAANYGPEIEAEFNRRMEANAGTTKQAEIDRTLPEDVQALQAEVNQFNPGFEVRYVPDAAKPYQYGIAGQKTLGRFTTLQGVERAIRKQPMLKPKKVVQGVEVKQMPRAKKTGLAARQNEDYQMSRDAVAPEDKAGKLNVAQEEQIKLLEKEIDIARKRREITDAERTKLVDMLRTPAGLEEARRLMAKGENIIRAKALRAEADPNWRAASDVQAEIDALTREGRQIREQELALEREQLELKKKGKKPTPQQAQSFRDRKTALSERATAVAKKTRTLGGKLLPLKQKIYKDVRAALEKMKAERQADIEQVEADFKAGKLSPARYRAAISEVRPEKLLYRKGRADPAGITLEALNDAVKDIVGRWKVALEPKLVQSVEDLPQSIRNEMEASDRLDAFGFLKGDTVYLIANNMHSVDDVAPTLFHEALGHLGLRRLFRDALDEVLVDLYDGNKKLAAAVDKWLEQNPDQYAGEERVARAVEEVLSEMSESGPLRASIMDKLVRFIREAVRKVFGINLKVTDGEINSILAMAHEQAMEGVESPVVGSSSIVYNRKAAEEQADADVKAVETSDKIYSSMERIQTSADRINQEGFFGSLSDAIKLRTAKNFLKALTPKRIADRFIPGGGLDALPTDALLDYADTVLGKGNTDGLYAAIDGMEAMNGYRGSIRRAQAKITEAIKKFINEHGSNSLGDALFFADDYNMDLKRFKEGMTLDEAYATDNLWNWYSRKLADPTLEAEKRKTYQEKLTKREGEIKEGFDAWMELGKFKGGRDVYERLSESFRDMYDVRQSLMRKYIEAQKAAGMSDESVAKLMQSYDEQFQKLNDTVNTPQEGDANVDHPDVPLGVFYRQYMPKRRYGQFWLRIKKTKFGEPILYFFESKTERDEALEQAAKEAGIDLTKPGSSSYFDVGKDVDMDLNELGVMNMSTAFNKALNVIAGIDPETVTENTKKKLQNDVYQLFLMAAPEGSVRKQFIRSKKRLGWSQDILRTFNDVSEEYASDISRLTYAPEIDGGLKDFVSRFDLDTKTAKGEIPTAQKDVARDFLNNVQRRIQSTMQPQAEGWVNRIVPGINQLAFVTFLTAPATALVQTTALPMRVAPHLYGKYGLADTAKAMERYMNVFRNTPKFMGKGKEVRKSMRIPTLREAANVKGVKHRAEALKWATDRGLTMPVSEFLLGEERAPTSAAQSKFQYGKQFAYDFMTYLFDTTEQLTREVTFLSAYDLEYDKLKDAGLAEEVRQEKAREAARYVVNYTLGDYSNLNRPLVFKSSELAKAFFLFKMYSAITTRFFVTNMKAVFKGESPEVRAAARKEMFGVLSMAFAFGGITGLPLYTFGMFLLQALQDATDDDEDRRQRMIDDPITADSVEAQFRYNWLPEKFGVPMVQGADGNNYTLSDIILNGPISELSGWNFGSRVSLDAVGMWFRAPKDADNWKTTVNNALVENIPGASASLNIVDMGEQFAKGDVEKALQLGMPAMIRAFAKTYEISQEGVRTQAGKIRLMNDQLGSTDYIGLLLGFNPTEIAKMSAKQRQVTGRLKELQEAKSKLTSAYVQALRRRDTGDPAGPKMLRKAVEDILEYREKIGNPDFTITDEALLKSVASALGEERYDIDGMSLTKTQEKYVRAFLDKQ